VTHSAQIGTLERPASAHDELWTALVRARAELGADELGLVAVRAPHSAVDGVLTAATDARLHWSSPGGDQMAGIGVAAELRASGPERFELVARAAETLWRSLRFTWLDASPPPVPRLFGGFAFQVGRAQSELWRPFGEAWFVLPRIVYVSDSERAWLGVALRASTGDSELADLAHTALGVLDRLEPRSPTGPLADRAAIVARSRPPSEIDFGDRVGAIRAAIESGRVEKVVAARRTVIELGSPVPRPLEVLERLRSEAGACTRFLFASDGPTFIGATPERLVNKRGACVETEAIAGSIRGEGDAEELLHSTKDLEEHAIVVRELVRCLEPLALTIETPLHPEIQRLNYVMHLRTPVRATLRESHHVLDLVARLHPTPAVGGVPRTPALEWIRAHEPDERGWYAGPIGWFDRSGDGEFWVALRSGLLEGSLAHLYAGAGIVAASDPSAEYAETRLKLASLLHALGVTP
jgi:menaquinone-specific isochorismate synthase